MVISLVENCNDIVCIFSFKTVIQNMQKHIKITSMYIFFLQIVRPLLHSESKFVVMGDFNTLSRHDRK